MIYNKEEFKGGRKLTSTGPRNIQTRTSIANSTSDDIKELKAEITKLAGSKNISTSGYSQQQVNDMLNEAIEEVSIDLEKKYLKDIRDLTKFLEDSKNEVSDLRAKIDIKDEALTAKDQVILDLTTKITELSSRPIVAYQPTDKQAVEEPNRPSIDNVFIDPSKKGAEDKMESYVKIKEIKSVLDTGADINKLKNLMGKLPKK